MAGNELGTDIPANPPDPARSTGRRAKLVGGAALAGSLLLGGVLIMRSDSVSDPRRPDEPAAVATPRSFDPPTDLAMTVDDSCASIERAAMALAAVPEIGDDAIVALQQVRDAVDPEVHADIDTILATYEALEAGHIEQLLDDDVVSGTTDAGDRLASYLTETCDIEMGQR